MVFLPALRLRLDDDLAVLLDDREHAEAALLVEERAAGPDVVLVAVPRALDDRPAVLLPVGAGARTARRREEPPPGEAAALVQALVEHAVQRPVRRPDHDDRHRPQR